MQTVGAHSTAYPPQFQSEAISPLRAPAPPKYETCNRKEYCEPPGEGIYRQPYLSAQKVVMQLREETHQCTNRSLHSSDLPSPRIVRRPPRMFFLRPLQWTHQQFPRAI